MALKVEKSMFFKLAKVDEAKQEVTGVIAAEEKDASNEIMDYEGSKPYFEAWSKEFSDKTNGLSLGNVRSMHNSKIAAGKLISIQYDDENKLIIATAKIVDKEEWEKVKEAVYTGFSIGGRYIKKWYDSALQVTKYIAELVEVSLVDNPCVSSAVFTVIKVDGTQITKSIAYTRTEELNKMEFNQELKDQFIKALLNNELLKAFSYEELRTMLKEAIKKGLSPVNLGYFWIYVTYPDYAILQVEAQDGCRMYYYKVTYSVNETGDITLGEFTQVKMTFEPVVATEQAAKNDSPEQPEQPKPENAEKNDNPEEIKKGKESENQPEGQPEQPEAKKNDQVDKSNTSDDNIQPEATENQINKSDTLAEVETVENNNNAEKNTIPEGGNDLNKAIMAEVLKALQGTEEYKQLEKVAKDNEELSKVNKELSSRCEELLKRVEKLEDMPDMGNAPYSNTSTVEKTLSGDKLQKNHSGNDLNKRLEEITEEVKKVNNPWEREKLSKNITEIGMLEAFKNPVPMFKEQ